MALLPEHAAALDTAGEGGAPDATISGKDLQAATDDASLPPDVRRAAEDLPADPLLWVLVQTSTTEPSGGSPTSRSRWRRSRTCSICDGTPRPCPPRVTRPALNTANNLLQGRPPLDLEPVA